MTELRTGELFAGAGGLGLGFILAEHPSVRFAPVFAVDNDEVALSSYQCNTTWLTQHVPQLLPAVPHMIHRDITRLRGSALLRLLRIPKGELDLLLGGPPCQGYSSSNRQSSAQRKRELNGLVKSFVDKLDELRPKMFLMENVQGLRWTQPTVDMAEGIAQPTLFSEIPSTLDMIHRPTSVQTYLINSATKLGYRVWHGVLDAADFGVPQHRYRFFLFGVLADILPAGEEINLVPYLKALKVSQPITVAEAIDDLPPLENGQCWRGDNYIAGNSEYVRKIRNLMTGNQLYDHFTATHADYVIERYSLIPEGGNWKSIRSLMTNYRAVDNTHSNIYRRLSREHPAITISHYRKAMIIHPTQDRGLSHREACRLQGFPDWFRFQGQAEEQRQQLANAVPPLMASAVAYAIGEWWIDHYGTGTDRGDRFNELPMLTRSSRE